jgi:hypothetical protein
MVAMGKERLCYHVSAENRGKFFVPFAIEVLGLG